MKMKTILLIDADSLLYQSCLNSKDEGGGDIDNLEDACFKFDEKSQYIINNLEDTYSLDIEHYIFFLEGKGNYRKVNPQYKANRKDKPTPVMLTPLKKWVIDNHPTFVSYNCETDDSVIAHYSKWKDNTYGYKVIIASLDKDLKTFPCTLFDYGYNRMELSEISQEEASYNFWVQMLMGDTSDNVKGIPKVGVKKAEKILKGKSVNHYGRTVYKEYIRYYKRKARLEFEKNYFMLRLNPNVNTMDIEEIFF